MISACTVIESPATFVCTLTGRIAGKTERWRAEKRSVSFEAGAATRFWLHTYWIRLCYGEKHLISFFKRLIVGSPCWEHADIFSGLHSTWTFLEVFMWKPELLYRMWLCTSPNVSLSLCNLWQWASEQQRNTVWTLLFCFTPDTLSFEVYV